MQAQASLDDSLAHSRLATGLVANRRVREWLERAGLLSSDHQTLWRTAPFAYKYCKMEAVKYSTSVIDEPNLLARAQSLDKSAIAQIHDAYYTALYRYFTFRVDDPQTAEDLTGELFIRFVQALHRRRGPRENIAGWLYGTAANLLKEHYRKQRKQRHVQLDDTIPGKGPGPEQDVDSNLAAEQLRQAIDELSPEQQEVLALRFAHGMPHRQVANTLGKSEGAVRMLQVRAIAALSELLSEAESSS